MQKEFIIMSAERSKLSPKENLERTTELEDYLKTNEFSFEQVKGVYEGKEETSFKIDITPAVSIGGLLSLALNSFEQDCILAAYSNGKARLLGDGFASELTTVNFVDEKPEGDYTEFTREGKNLYMVLGE